jgi:hypothetical protein
MSTIFLAALLHGVLLDPRLFYGKSGTKSEHLTYIYVKG